MDLQRQAAEPGRLKGGGADRQHRIRQAAFPVQLEICQQAGMETVLILGHDRLPQQGANPQILRRGRLLVGNGGNRYLIHRFF